MSIYTLAKNMGASVLMIEQHYGHVLLRKKAHQIAGAARNNSQKIYIKFRWRRRIMMQVLSKTLLAIGVLIIFWFMFVFDTSVSTGYGRVNNLGLMSQRQNFLILGGLFLIAGFALMLLNKSSLKNNVLDVNSKNKEELNFWNEKIDIKNDAYKLYLIKKYNIEKNEVLGKYVVDLSTYETLDEAIEKISIFDEEKKLKIITSNDFVKNTGEISGFFYTEYGDGSVKIRLTRNKVMNFESILEARRYFNK